VVFLGPPGDRKTPHRGPRDPGCPPRVPGGLRHHERVGAPARGGQASRAARSGAGAAAADPAGLRTRAGASRSTQRRRRCSCPSVLPVRACLDDREFEQDVLGLGGDLPRRAPRRQVFDRRQPSRFRPALTGSCGVPASPARQGAQLVQEPALLGLEAFWYRRVICLVTAFRSAIDSRNGSPPPGASSFPVKVGPSRTLPFEATTPFEDIFRESTELDSPRWST
jgi:hypothetical protein